MGEVSKELWEAIMKQTTDNVPKLYIQDVVSGRVFEYGKNCHDKLLISEDGRSLNYYNFQNCDDSAVGDYRFYYEKPEDETDFDADEWARTVEHQSISELLAEERKKVVQEIREKAFKKEIFYTGKKSEQGWKNEYWLFDFELEEIERNGK